MLKSLYLFLELFWCSRVSLPEVVTKVGAVTVAGLVRSCGHLFLWPISNVVQGKNPLLAFMSYPLAKVPFLKLSNFLLILLVARLGPRKDNKLLKLF